MHLCVSGIINGWIPKKRKRCLGSHRIAISDIGEDKSFVDDLNTERGIVSSRVALLLRSAEIKPLFSRFVLKRTFSSPEPLVTAGHYMSLSRWFSNTSTIHTEGIVYRRLHRMCINSHMKVYHPWRNHLHGGSFWKLQTLLTFISY